MKKLLSAMLITLLILTTLCGCVDSDYTYPDEAEYTKASAFGAAMSEVKDINVDWFVGNIAVESDETAESITVTEIFYDDENGLAQISNDRYNMRYRIKDGVLDIRFAASGIQLKDIRKDLKIVLPKTDTAAVEKLSVSAKTCNTSLNGVNIGKVIFASMTGKIIAENCAMEVLNMAGMTGETQIKGSQIGSIMVVAVSGSFTVTDSTLGACCITGVACDVSLSLNTVAPKKTEIILLSTNGVNVEMPCGNGVKAVLESSNGNVIFDTDAIKNDAGEYIIGNGENEITLAVESGDISLVLKQTPADSGNEEQTQTPTEGGEVQPQTPAESGNEQPQTPTDSESAL